MDGVVVIAVLLAGAGVLAVRCYRNPDGVIWKSLAAALAPPALVLGLWFLMGPRIANEAGFGFFVILVAAAALGAAGAFVAISASLARRLVDALNR